MAYQHQHFGSVNSWNATRCSPESTSFIQSGGESERFSPMGYASPMGHMPYPVNNLGLRQPTYGYRPQEGAMHLPVSIQHPSSVNNTSWSQAPRQVGMYSSEQLQQASSIAPLSSGVKMEPYCNQSVVEQHCPSLSCSTEYPVIDKRFQIQNYEMQGQTESEKRSVQYLRQAAMQNTEQTVLPKSLHFSQSSSWAEFYRKFLNYARDKQWSSRECKTYMGYVLEGKTSEHFQFLTEQDPNLPYYDLLNKMEDFMKKHNSHGVMSPVKICPYQNLTETKVQNPAPHVYTYKHNPLSPNMFQEPHSSSSCESFGGTERYSYCDTPQTLHSSFLRNHSNDTDTVSNVENVCQRKNIEVSNDSHIYIGEAEESKPMQRQRYVRYRGSSKTEPTDDVILDADNVIKQEGQKCLSNRMASLESMFKHITELVDSQFSKQHKSEQESSVLHDTKKPSLHDQHSSTLHDPKLPTSKHAQFSKALHDSQTPLQSTLQNEKGRPGSFDTELFKQEQSSKTRIKSEEAEQRIQSLENYADWLDDLSNQLVVTSTPKGESSRLLPEYGDWSPEECEWSENGENSSLQLLFSETSQGELPESPAATANGAQAFQQGSREPCSIFTDIQESNSEKQEFWWDSLETRGIRAEDEADSVASCEQFIDGMYYRLFGDSTPINTCTSEEHETWIDNKFADTIHSVSLQEFCLKDKEVRETELVEEIKSPAPQEQTNSSLHEATSIWQIEEGNQPPSLKGNLSQDSEECSDTSFGTVTIYQDHTSSSLKVPVTVQGVALNAIIDTAAMVTVISDKLYKEIAVKPESLKTAILKTAGHDQKINGQVVGPVSVKLGESVYAVLVHVAPIYEDMLLGFNFLIEDGLEINVTEQYLLVRQNKERIPLEISASPRKGCVVSKVTTERVEYIQDSPATLVKHVPLQERAACSLYQPEYNKQSHITSTRLQWDSRVPANLQQTGSCDPGHIDKQFNQKQIGSLGPRPSNVQCTNFCKAIRLAIGLHAHTEKIMTLTSKQKSEYVSNYSCQHSGVLEPQKSPVQWISEDDVAWPWDPGGRLLENN